MWGERNASPPRVTVIVFLRSPPSASTGTIGAQIDGSGTKPRARRRNAGAPSIRSATRIVGAGHEFRSFVRDDEIGDTGEAAFGFGVVHHERLAARIGGRRHQHRGIARRRVMSSPSRPSPELGEQQMVQRGIREHDTYAGETQVKPTAHNAPGTACISTIGREIASRELDLSLLRPRHGSE